VSALQTYYNRECCIEMLAKECQKYRNMVYNTSHMGYHSTEDLWQQHYDSAESLSSMSSGHSIGAPSFGQPSQAIGHSFMRSSQSYPYIPPTESSGRVHDPTPRSSLPMASLDVVPPSQQFRGMDGSKPATAAVMQHDPFSFRTDTQRSTLRQDGRVELGQNLSSYNFPGESSTAVPTTKQKTITTGVSYRVNCSRNAGCKPTYLSATHVNMPACEEGGGKLGLPAHETSGRSQNRLSDPVLPTALSNPSSNACSAMYINPQQAWVSSRQTPTTYVSSLSSSYDCLASVTGVSETAVYPSSSPCTPANSALAYRVNSSSPRLSQEPMDDPEYTNGMKCITVMLHRIQLSY